jgi:hypothetical protein
VPLAPPPVAALPPVFVSASDRFTAGLYAFGFAIFGLILGFLARWAVAGVLYLFRALGDMGHPWRSPGMWVEKSSVICGILVCILTIFLGTNDHFGNLARKIGYSHRSLAARVPGLYWGLPLVFSLLVLGFVLSRYLPQWRASEATEQRLASLVSQGMSLESEDYLVSPPGGNAAEIYRKVLEENALHRGAHEGCQRIRERLLVLARSNSSQGNLADAEAVFQQWIANGYDETWMKNERGKLYRVEEVVASGKWSDRVDIGERICEIVSDGPFEMANADISSSKNLDFRGRRMLDVGVQVVRFRCLDRDRTLTLYIAYAPEDDQIRNPINLFPNRKARTSPIAVTIGTNGQRTSEKSTRVEATRQMEVAPALPAHPIAVPAPKEVSPINRYRARISRRDRVNSKGQDLTQIPNIRLQDFLQQDCYNFCRKNIRDDDDQLSYRNYDQLSPLFGNPLSADTSPACFKAVLDGEPLLEVSIYQNVIRVRLIQP